MKASITQKRTGIYDFEFYNDTGDRVFYVEEFEIGKPIGVGNYTFIIYDNDPGICGNDNEKSLHFAVGVFDSENNDEGDPVYFYSFGDETIEIDLPLEK